MAGGPHDGLRFSSIALPMDRLLVSCSLQHDATVAAAYELDHAVIHSYSPGFRLRMCYRFVGYARSKRTLLQRVWHIVRTTCGMGRAGGNIAVGDVVRPGHR
jgi:hypothetical protein